jgi:branched-chain amino acid aminotransferase
MDVLNWVWVNGSFWSKDEARVDVFNAGLASSMSISVDCCCFKTEKGALLFKVEDILDRFYSDVESMGLSLKIVKTKLIKDLKRVVDENEVKECFLRVVAFASDGPLFNNKHASIAIIPYTIKLKSESLVLKSSPVSFSEQDNIIVKQSKESTSFLDIKELNCDDVVFFDSDRLFKTSKGFLILVKKDVLFIPNFECVERNVFVDSIIQLAKDSGYLVKVGELKRDHLKLADSMFVVGPFNHFTLVKEFDGAPMIPDLELVSEVKQNFESVLKGEDDSYMHWFEEV